MWATQQGGVKALFLATIAGSAALLLAMLFAVPERVANGDRIRSGSAARDERAVRVVFRLAAFTRALGEERNAAVLRLVNPDEDSERRFRTAVAVTRRRWAALGTYHNNDALSENQREAVRRQVIEGRIDPTQVIALYSRAVDTTGVTMLAAAARSADVSVARSLFAYTHYVQASDQMRRASAMVVVLSGRPQAENLRGELARSSVAWQKRIRAFLSQLAPAKRIAYAHRLRRSDSIIEARVLIDTVLATGNKAAPVLDPDSPRATFARAQSAMDRLQAAIVADLLRRIDRAGAPAGNMRSTAGYAAAGLLGLAGLLLVEMRRSLHGTLHLRIAGISPRIPASPASSRILFLSNASARRARSRRKSARRN